MPCTPPYFVIRAGSHRVRLAETLVRIIILNLVDWLFLSVLVTALTFMRQWVTVELVMAIDFRVVDCPVPILRRD